MYNIGLRIIHHNFEKKIIKINYTDNLIIPFFVQYNSYYNIISAEKLIIRMH